MTERTLILTRKDLAALMTRADYLAAVEDAFRAEKERRAFSPPPMHIDGEGGVFHAKGAALKNTRAFVALKLNGNFPENPARCGLPTIQGAVLFCDAKNGVLLAVFDSIEVTLRRTAAASALAAKHLAPKDASTLLICGCGDQGRVQAEAVSDIRSFRRGYAWDIDRDKAKTFARAMERNLGFKFTAVGALAHASRKSDVIVACTTASEPFLTPELVSPGTFIAAVGADSPQKNEIAPALMARARVVVDTLDQCMEMGDLRAAIAAGAMTANDVCADLGDIVTGAKEFRVSPNDIVIFDSTGTALQDVASVALAYKRAEAGEGRLAVALGAR